MIFFFIFAPTLVLHIAPPPLPLPPQDFESLGDRSDGCSGSDISVITREALMEPLRKCQNAKVRRLMRSDAALS